MTHRLMIIHYHTKFGKKWFSSLGDTAQTQLRHTEKISSVKTFTDILNLCCDLGLEHSDPIFLQDTPTYDAVPTNQV